MKRRCSKTLPPTASIACRSLSDASCWYHSSQWLATPCSGLRSSAAERKLSVLQCQKVQNQTKRNYSLRYRALVRVGRRAQDEPERHRIRHPERFPRCGELARQLDINSIFTIGGELGVRREYRLQSRFRHKGHLEDAVAHRSLRQLEAQSEPSVTNIHIKHAGGGLLLVILTADQCGDGMSSVPVWVLGPRVRVRKLDRR